MSDPQESEETINYCSMPIQPPREMDSSIHPGRAEAIIDSDLKWVSGTKLRYYFFEEDEIEFDGRQYKWLGGKKQEDAVREAFAAWGALNLGVTFEEVNTASEAEIRIGFLGGDGSWSWVGRRILEEPTTARTLNIGWNIVNDVDTAIHEIGHTLGMPHEHQNPFAGIEWDEEAVYHRLAGPPNFWSRDKTFHNILRKLPPDSVRGSKWDPDSIMHYQFSAGMILEPEKYRTQALIPKPGLSTADKAWAKKWYPPVGRQITKLEPFQSHVVDLEPREQAHFAVEPTATRRYRFTTIGEADTVMVLFEEVDGELRYRAGDDDSGQDRNALLVERLYRGRRYVLRLRLYWAAGSGSFAVVMF